MSNVARFTGVYWTAQPVIWPAAAALAGRGAGPASRLLLLDEPEQSLDAGFRQELAGLLRLGYAAHGGTVIMATHDADFAAAAGARLILLADGRVTAPGLAGPKP